MAANDKQLAECLKIILDNVEDTQLGMVAEALASRLAILHDRLDEIGHFRLRCELMEIGNGLLSLAAHLGKDQ